VSWPCGVTDGPADAQGEGEKVIVQEAVLERQMTEHTRLQLQLKSKRSLWGGTIAKENAEVALSDKARREKNGPKWAIKPNRQHGINDLA
jgi:hypothetical protein